MSRLEISVMSYFGEVQSCKNDAITPEFITNAIVYLLSISKDQFLLNQHQDCDELLGYKSFFELKRKTELIELRIENSKIYLFRGVKVKRWYEFEPVDTNWYSLDKESILELSSKVYNLFLIYYAK